MLWLRALKVLFLQNNANCPGLNDARVLQMPVSTRGGSQGKSGGEIGEIGSHAEFQHLSTAKSSEGLIPK